MIEIFQTNVSNVSEAALITSQLKSRHQLEKISFDLDDCDRVLRVESTRLDPTSVIQYLKASGFHCSVMPD